MLTTSCKSTNINFQRILLVVLIDHREVRWRFRTTAISLVPGSRSPLLVRSKGPLFAACQTSFRARILTYITGVTFYGHCRIRLTIMYRSKVRKGRRPLQAPKTTSMWSHVKKPCSLKLRETITRHCRFLRKSKKGNFRSEWNVQR